MNSEYGSTAQHAATPAAMPEMVETSHGICFFAPPAGHDLTAAGPSPMPAEATTGSATQSEPGR